MRIIVAECSAVYTGRGDTRLTPAVRAIIIKEDGAVSLHHDSSNKPLNYMGKGNALTVDVNDEGEDVWSFDSSKESLQITIHNLVLETNMPLDIHNSELQRDGTERQLQEWLSMNPSALDPDWVFVQREYSTTAGPVDLLFVDSEGIHYCVEVKRVALTNSIHQVLRYNSAIQEDDETIGEVIPVVAALEMRPKALTIAEKKKVRFLKVPFDWNSKDDIV